MHIYAWKRRSRKKYTKSWIQELQIIFILLSTVNMYYVLTQLFSTGSNSVPRGPFGNTWRHFWCDNSGERVHVMLASSSQRSVMLLNVLQCTGKPSQQRIIQLKTSIVPRWRNPEKNTRIYSNRETVLERHEALPADLACPSASVAIPSHPPHHVWIDSYGLASR